MGRTVAQTISETCRRHLQEQDGLIFGQCLTAVGWVGGTVPALPNDPRIVELSMADVAGSGIAVGAALVGRRPIFVVRYQGFMWYNAATLLNYAAKSMDMWQVPCPVFVRGIAMEGGIGPVATGCHHGMVMRMPGIPVIAPMTPGEWLEAWDYFVSHDDPIFCSEHRRSFPIEDEMPDIVHDGAAVTLLGISAGRLNAMEAHQQLEAAGVTCDMIHVKWLKPFKITDSMRRSLTNTKLGLIIDGDFEIAAAGRSIAYELMHATGAAVHAIGLEDRTAGFAPHLDNMTPSADRIVSAVERMLAE